MQCPQCQHQNKPTARFCESCGAALARRCPSCGEDLGPPARFCAGCGERLRERLPVAPAMAVSTPAPEPEATLPAGERRQLTVLFCFRRIRAGGLLAGAITNNWVAEDGGTRVLQSNFDVFAESAVVGIRKPGPRLFHLTCDELGVAPSESVFLDDIGINLKAARALGMTTIKVDQPDTALAELETVLGFPLR